MLQKQVSTTKTAQVKIKTPPTIKINLKAVLRTK